MIDGADEAGQILLAPERNAGVDRVGVDPLRPADPVGGAAAPDVGEEAVGMRERDPGLAGRDLPLEGAPDEEAGQLRDEGKEIVGGHPVLDGQVERSGVAVVGSEVAVEVLT